MIELSLQLQPLLSNLCGQVCVAMIVNKPVQDVLFITGKGKTCAPVLRKALKHFGILCSSKTERVRKNTLLPDLAIVRLHYRGNKKISHWTVLANGKYYDPEYGIIEKYSDLIYATSFLRVIC